MSIASSLHVCGCCFGWSLEGYWDTIVQALVKRRCCYVARILSLADGPPRLSASVLRNWRRFTPRRREWAAVIAVGAVAALLVGDIPVHPDHVI